MEFQWGGNGAFFIYRLNVEIHKWAIIGEWEHDIAVVSKELFIKDDRRSLLVFLDIISYDKMFVGSILSDD